MQLNTHRKSSQKGRLKRSYGQAVNDEQTTIRRQHSEQEIGHSMRETANPAKCPQDICTCVCIYTFPKSRLSTLAFQGPPINNTHMPMCKIQKNYRRDIKFLCGKGNFFFIKNIFKTISQFSRIDVWINTKIPILKYYSL